MLDTQVLWLPVDSIAPNPAQPRRDFDPVPLSELADSIRRHGILQPLSVRRRANAAFGRQSWRAFQASPVSG